MLVRIRIHGSMPLTNGSGSCYFRHWPSRCQNFSAYYFLKVVHLHHFPKKNSQKESQNSRNQGFSYYFCMMIEGSGSGGFGSGSATLILTIIFDGCHSFFIFILSFSIHAFQITFLQWFDIAILLHSPRPLSISSLHFCSVGNNLPGVPSRDLNSALPTELRCTLGE
jgi:hypothetical protein